MDLQQTAAASPDVTVTLGGSSLARELRGWLTAVTVTESVDAAGSFALEFQNWDADTGTVRVSDHDALAPGAAVVIKLGYDEGVEPVIDGEITGLEFWGREGQDFRLVARGYDRLHRLRRGRRTKSYLQAKDSDVAEQIAGELGLTPEVEATSEVHEYLLQANQTDIDFLLARARAIGYELSADAKTLRFRKSRHDRGKAITIDPTHGLVAFQAYLSTAEQVSQVIVRGWDPKAKQALTGQAQASQVTGAMNGRTPGPGASKTAFGESTLTLIDHPVATQGEADLLAQGVLDRIALDYLTAEVTAVGNPAVRAGTVVEIGGLGERFSGLYYVTEVEHAWQQRYLTRARMRRNAS
jgi:phage protein D